MSALVFNSVIFLAGLLLLVFSWAILFYKRKRIDLLDMYIFVVFLFLVIPCASVILNAHPKYSIDLGLTVFWNIAFPLMVVWFCFDVMCKKEVVARFQRYLTFDYFFSRLARVWDLPFIVFFALLFLFKIYELHRYGFLYSYDKTTLNFYGYAAPYWFTSLNSIYLPTVFAVSLIWMAKALSVNGWRRLFYYGLLGMAFLLSFFYRREGLFNFVFIFIIFLLLRYSNKIFTKRFLVGAVLGGLVFYGAINTFQVYRVYHDLYKKSLAPERVMISSLKQPLFALYNIKTRRGIMWEFNYKILQPEAQQDVSAKKGRLLYHSALNSVPKFLWKNKRIVDVDRLLFKTYHILGSLSFDWNFYGFLQADFGYYSIPIAIIFLFLFFIAASFLLKLVEKHSLLFVFYLGYIMDYLLWVISRSYGEIFILIRNLILITIVYWLYYVIKTGIVYCKDHLL